MSTPSPPPFHRLYSSPNESSILPFDYFTKSNTSADLILVVEDVKFRCHRLLLSLISPVFTRMFDGQFKEHEEQEIILNGKKSSSILELLTYIYPQFYNSVNSTNIEDFLQLADEYMIDHIKQPCHEYLDKELKQYKYVIIPINKKIQQPTLSSKQFHASDSSLDTDRSHHSYDPRTRPISSSRISSSTGKPLSSKHLHPPKSDTPSKYFVTVNQTEIPKYLDSNSSPLTFTNDEIRLWLKRLQVLYTIDKCRYFEGIIEQILSLLQFIPSTIILQLFKITSLTDEQLLNDLLRARLFFLEGFDGTDVKCLIQLPDAYRTFIKMTTVQQNEDISPSNDQPLPDQEYNALLNITLIADEEQNIT
ncbi:unnamed protein product [Didymodactylos carnosus]|uniref:BTB domain-containing protein n=1 Tax=Didymodactylos carnosus TaxID=1234261 RepID=A0A814WN22_9BILA|nr:unnamed protein product [Didymodactylos carnosus]CAF1203903.1 unnamed protein product [Didymodactylos carnosus]CAF3730735.1 unnamed protein product [Didymodactylos carnosus]CAF3968308.1 unnamed protein product [Didymodactylos carnosus]